MDTTLAEAAAHDVKRHIAQVTARQTAPAASGPLGRSSPKLTTR
jgi:hypothetical protein